VWLLVFPTLFLNKTYMVRPKGLIPKLLNSIENEIRC
jgi:hypothetical protein